MILQTQYDVYCQCGAPLDIVDHDMITTPGRIPKYKLSVSPCRECSTKKPSKKRYPTLSDPLTECKHCDSKFYDEVPGDKCPVCRKRHWEKRHERVEEVRRNHDA